MAIGLSNPWSILAQVTIFALFVLAAAVGNYGAYVAMFAVLAFLLFSFDRVGLGWALRQAWVRMILSSFLLLAVAFAFSARNLEEYSFILDFIPLLLVVPAAALMRRFQPDDGVLYLARLALAGSVAAMVVGIIEAVIFGNGRASGLENSPIHFADLAMLAGFMALAGLFRQKGPSRLIYLLGPICGLVASLLAGTRAAILVGFVLALVFVLMFWRQWAASLWQKLAVFALVVAGVIAVGVVGYLLGFTRFLEAFQIARDFVQGGQVTDSSSLYRLEMYRSGVFAFMDAPLFGHGWHNQIAAALPYMSEIAREGYALDNWGYLHNEPLGFAVSAGFLGIVSYCLLTFAPLAGLWGKGPSIGQLYLAIALVVGFFVSGATDVLLMSELPKTFFVFIGAAIIILCQEPRDGSAERPVLG